MIRPLSILLLIAWHLDITDGLDCYNCINISNLTDCHTFMHCSGDDYCYTKTTAVGDQTRYTLGCRSKQICLPSTTTTQPDISIVGRDAVPYVDCTQCCAIDACNKQLCTTGIHPDISAGCEDDPTFNCPEVSAIFNICSDIHHAKLKCKKFCGLCSLVDGLWSIWQSWSSCDRTCGNGTKSRTRACDNPVPSDGGLQCQGENQETSTCSPDACPVHGKWASWLSWGTCSVTCGVGLERRDRICSSPSPGPNGDHCYGDATTDRVCFTRACADGFWSFWSSWGTCSASCLGGLSKRTRICNNPTPSQFGLDCVGNTEDTKICNTQHCQDAQNGGWSSWSTWGICSKYCEDGEQTRQRSCNNPSPGPFGRTCSGTDWQARACNIRPCRNGVWSSWSTWGSCSASCLGGLSKRTRLCDNPAPSQYGHACIGNAEDTKICNTHYCQVTNGGWSSWASWSSCTAKCNGGSRKRTRLCNNPTPSAEGHMCLGNNEQGAVCNSVSCLSNVRLVDGNSVYNGRLEVYHNGEWGTVCDDSFSDKAARVVCKQLHYPTVGAIKYSNAHFGRGDGSIFLDNVVCSGTESSLFSCSHSSWNTHDCSHGEDVGISCLEHLSIRLTGGSSYHRT